MHPEQNIEYIRVIDEVHERLQAIGLSDPRVTVATAVVILGGEKVLDIHGRSPEELQIVYKAEAGKTPRTVADMESGRVGKELIKQQFPTHRINEEESGDEQGDENAHHFDPLDGTSSYARGLRYSTVGEAVYEKDRPFASAISHPFEREIVVAQVGKGAHLFKLDEHLRTLTYARQLAVSNLPLEGGIAFIDALFNGNTKVGKFAFMADLVGLANDNLGFRMSGSNIDQQLKVAKGSAELSLTDAVGGFFDLAAGALAIREAGGKFTDQNGNPVTESTQIAIGTNGLIHDAVLEVVNKHYRDYQGFK